VLAADTIVPLSPSEATRLETTTQRSLTVDEAAFYALLENAAKWPEKATPQSAGDEEVVFAPFGKIKAEPQNWQGRLVMIEGKLEAVLPPRRLSRQGWERVEGLIIRPEGAQPIIVYLTHPPLLERDHEGSQYVSQRGAQVKLVARFFKLVEHPNRNDEPTLYPVFVGRDASGIEADTSVVPQGFGIIPLAGLGIAGCIFLLYFRVRRMKRGQSATHLTLAEYKRQRLERRKLREASEGGDDDSSAQDEAPIDLPKDPAQALNALTQRHDDEADRQ
jgi:hypothetical protein